MLEINDIIKILDDNGDSNLIFAAIDTYDMARVVRTAAKALEPFEFDYKPNILTHSAAKSKEGSTAFRKRGNIYYTTGNYTKAVRWYNLALAVAPKHSQELMLAYGNRSAVFLKIRLISACINDINLVLSMACSDILSRKLKQRLNEASSMLPEEKIYQDNQDYARTFFKIDCKLNSDVPCASDDLLFEKDGAKRVTARRDIETCAVMAVEKAFVTDLNDVTCRIFTCQYCHKIKLALYACDGCFALFCSERCKVKCEKEYHSIYCQISESCIMRSDPVNEMMTKSAIKLSLKLGWDDFIAASKDIGASRMERATVSQAFNCKDPLSILSYDDDKLFLEGRMFNGSIICAGILKLLCRIPNYFPKEGNKRNSATDAMARVMMKLFTTFTNKIPICCPVINVTRNERLENVPTNFGWFSMCSKLKHSCDPNTFIVGFKDSVALLAKRTIKKGEELTISYIDHQYEQDNSNSLKQFRALTLFRKTQIMCSCRECLEDWDANSAVRHDEKHKLKHT